MKGRRPARGLDWLGARDAHDPCVLPRRGTPAGRCARSPACHRRGARPAWADRSRRGTGVPRQRRPAARPVRAGRRRRGLRADRAARSRQAGGSSCTATTTSTASAPLRSPSRCCATSGRRGRAVPAQSLRAGLRRRGRDRRGAGGRRHRTPDHRRLRHHGARGRGPRPRALAGRRGDRPPPPGRRAARRTHRGLAHARRGRPTRSPTCAARASCSSWPRRSGRAVTAATRPICRPHSISCPISLRWPRSPTSCR